MKAFAKLGLLLAIVVAGRQLRQTSTAALIAQPNATAVVARPDTLQFDSFASTQATPVAPVSHRTPQQKADSGFTVWY